ncbi:RadC family protein [Paenibacillus sp. Leaf72]|uniref:RadC family protein n=1 Tax=Paenibacillus sp. Leaf72 TaxID=1736234 RepID=UPI0007006B9C|nr:DNA repair protein RadC [Paenibacillus sp. Leaf72]KQN96202.1 DNA repair protein RadC [Paenibacillus sp. Leaf72]
MLKKSTPTDLKSLLAYSLREKPGSDIVEEIFRRFPTFSDLIDVTEQELLAIEGVGRAKAMQIVATLKLSQIISSPSPLVSKIRSPMDVYKLLEPEFRHLKQEQFICLFLNTKNGVMSKEVISIGSLNACIVHPREVFRMAIKRSCASIICAHNHPSGNPDPSQEDISITKRLVEAGTIIGIEMLDHVVIGNNKYSSLKEQGLM